MMSCPDQKNIQRLELMIQEPGNEGYALLSMIRLGWKYDQQVTHGSDLN